MKSLTAFALVAALSISSNAQVVDRTPLGQPAIDGCAAQNVFRSCWSIGQDARSRCQQPVPGSDSNAWYQCLCDTSIELIRCFDQCPDSATAQNSKKAYENERTSYCGAVTKPTTTSTTAGAKTSAPTASPTANVDKDSKDSGKANAGERNSAPFALAAVLGALAFY
ncbi:hypothetical protein BKA69DRAFT_1092962 [Paraphysoderma sedebokerense]|nr:hypothetical protein BKA69DRAFT_1092962 [Paraphysoderma sedebokerense]